RELRATLRTARARGYAEEDGEVTAGFASVAAAVVDHTGRPVAGLALTFRSEEYDDDARAGLARRAAVAAREVSRRLGARYRCRKGSREGFSRNSATRAAQLQIRPSRDR